MTFDEAINHIKHTYDYDIDIYTVIDIIEDLQKEYDTKEQL